MDIIFGDYGKYLELKENLLNALEQIELRYFSDLIPEDVESPAASITEDSTQGDELSAVNNHSIAIEYSPSIEQWSHNSGASVYFEAFNNGDETIKNAVYSFSSNFQIRENSTDIWGARILSEIKTSEGYNYEIELNSAITPNSSLSFGFNTLEPEPSFTDFPSQGKNDTPKQPPIPELEQTPEREDSPPNPDSNVSSNGRPIENKSIGFYVRDGKIFDANDQEFIARGVNNRHVWFDHRSDTPALNSLDNIAGFGFNSVRIVWEIDHDGGVIPNRQGDLTDDALLERIIQETIDNGMVPMLELHDFTGRNDNQQLLDEGVSWWTERAELWQKYEKYLIINIANEYGNFFKGRDSASEFPELYTEAISRIREAGINNTLVVDSFGYAKDFSVIAQYGQEVLESDPQKNVAFGVHFYCGAGENPDEIREAFDSITGQGLPLIIGEYGSTHSPCGDVREDIVIEEAENYGVGTYAWAWDDKEWALARNWEADSYGELTTFGQTVVDHVQSDGLPASIF